MMMQVPFFPVQAQRAGHDRARITHLRLAGDHPHHPLILYPCNDMLTSMSVQPWCLPPVRAFVEVLDCRGKSHSPCV